MAGHEFTLSFETTPPTATKPGSPFTIPVVIAVNPIGTPAQNVQHLVVSASLRDEAGTGPAAGLSGSLTASVRSRTDNAMSGYAKLSPLTISQPGKFRLRVMLSAASYNGVVTKEYVDSTIIHVHAGAAAAQRPSGSILFLAFGRFCFVAGPSSLLFPSFLTAPLPPWRFSLQGQCSAPPARLFRTLADTQTLAPTQVARLQRLTAENLDISTADIAAWQHA